MTAEREFVVILRMGGKPFFAAFLAHRTWPVAGGSFVSEFNNERPHEALDMKVPADVYLASNRPYQGLAELDYPLHDKDVIVTCCGRICMHRKNRARRSAPRHQGVDDGIWLVSFMHYDLGYIDLEQRTPANPRQPVRREVATYVSGTTCYLCVPNGQTGNGAA